jgi:opacity protein-like surface antigen
LALGILNGVAASCCDQADGMCGYAKPKETVKEQIKDQGFYIKIGSGASFSTKASISASPAVWDPANQGYSSGLGTAAIMLAGLGYDSPYITADVTTSYRPNFSYSKFQTPTTTATPGTIGETTRKFDLDVSSVMVSLYLNGRGFNCLNWEAGAGSSIYPFIGGGVGASELTLYNFRSTGLASVADGFPAFASENQYSVSYRFTYQLMAGLEYRYRDVCALSIGYRWFDVANFRGPRYLRDSQGNAIDVQSNTWKIKFDANEAFIEFKVFL